jgi:hypothetical protein
MDNCCEKCNKVFVTKYTLKKHIESNVCDKKNEKNNSVLTMTCSSFECDYKTVKKTDLQRHIKSCKYIEIDNVHEKYQKEIEKLRNEYQKEIDQLRNEHQKEILNIQKACMEKEQDRLTSLFEKVITKPAVMNNTTNNTTTTTIRGSNNNLQSFLASPELYEKQVDPERINSINQSDVERHFWSGQKGIARFCVDHIVNTTDEEGNSKMLLCCTDPSRKRFKYVDADNQVVDDIEARHFIDTVSAPIVTVCRKVYDSVVRKIEDDKKGTKDAFDLNLLENKTNIAQQKFLEINNIGDHNRNSDYKNEMSILLKK